MLHCPVSIIRLYTFYSIPCTYIFVLIQSTCGAYMYNQCATKKFVHNYDSCIQALCQQIQFNAVAVAIRNILRWLCCLYNVVAQCMCVMCVCHPHVLLMLSNTSADDILSLWL